MRGLAVGLLAGLLWMVTFGLLLAVAGNRFWIVLAALVDSAFVLVPAALFAVSLAAAVWVAMAILRRVVKS